VVKLLTHHVHGSAVCIQSASRPNNEMEVHQVSAERTSGESVDSE
jgi:hypothetical protein